MYLVTFGMKKHFLLVTINIRSASGTLRYAILVAERMNYLYLLQLSVSCNVVIVQTPWSY